MRRRGMGYTAPTPAQRAAWEIQRTQVEARRADKEARAAALWNSDVVPLDQVPIPPLFGKDSIMRLWYLSHCGPDGSFAAVDDPQAMGFVNKEAPRLPFLRRLKIASKLAPLVIGKYTQMLWNISGWQLVMQVSCDILVGFMPAWGTFAQGQLVDAVQRSLYSKDVTTDEIIRLALWSIVASNSRTLIGVILAGNARLCQDLINREADRINLQLNLDVDMPSSSNPVVTALLQDCKTFEAGTRTRTEIPHLHDLIVFLSVLANIISSSLLAFGTLKAFFSFDTSSLVFVALAVFPTFFSEVLRKQGIFNPTANFVARQRSEKQAHTFYQIATSYAFKQEVILFGLRDWILETWLEFKAESDRYRDPQDDVMTKALTASSMPENIIKDVLYLFLGLRLFSEKITLGSLHVIQTTIGTVYYNISAISARMDMTMDSVFCIAALIAAQDWVKERKEGKDRTVVYQPKEPGVGEKRGMKIEARGLSFRYPSGQVDALRDINITIEAGQTLAIVGFNGSGKSSLAKVLTGLYDYEGSLLIDGVEAKTYRRDSLHRYMTVCPQNFAVFPLSIRENVGIGEIDEIDNDAAIMDAVKRGGADEVIKTSGLDALLVQNATPNMMNWDAPNRREKVINPTPATKDASNDKTDKSTGLGEKEAAVDTPNELPADGETGPPQPTSVPSDSLAAPGVNGQSPKVPRRSKALSKAEPTYVSLSGGQMQRVAISRAFMRADQATLVVLDEPSASLDARAEHELFQRIHALSRGASDETRTTIYISHRFSTVRRADKIAVVEDGTITEFGSHKELMELDGRYAEFFNLQVKAFSEE
ncbi:hypothetical protein M408DRAFT_19794 [Serendipita vermifera MAFF 305830]|uniref:ABC transporter domain-containing protein n=1 Tax=Serendipita vermifera MAFF 305830 TaxID=933852 RepID=A0A0C2X5X9_SERVB|nr:hypothetical protein M408DRAFT_19794 [Serendipita vermifera MAFF 305830]